MVVYANGKGAVNISGPATRDGVLNIHPTWGPNGAIVFASNRNGNFDLYRWGKSVTNSIVRMTKTPAPMQTTDPDYSADGKMLAFSRTSLAVVPRAASLYTMRAIPGAPATKLTENFGLGLGDRGAAWAPNGRQIAFYSDRAGNDNLYLVNWDGTAMRQLTSNKADDSQPSWSPDGWTLVFLSDRSSYTELWMSSLTGAGLGDPVAWQDHLRQAAEGRAGLAALESRRSLAR